MNLIGSRLWHKHVKCYWNVRSNGVGLHITSMDHLFQFGKYLTDISYTLCCYFIHGDRFSVLLREEQDMLVKNEGLDFHMDNLAYLFRKLLLAFLKWSLTVATQ